MEKNTKNKNVKNRLIMISVASLVLVLGLISYVALSTSYKQLKNENKGNILGQYIESLSGYPADSLEYQALCEGVQALMETRRG